jgi:hypothetical protein
MSRLHVHLHAYLRERLGEQRMRGIVVTRDDLTGLLFVGCPSRFVRWLVERHLQRLAYQADGNLLTIYGVRATPSALPALPHHHLPGCREHHHDGGDHVA